MKASGVTLIEMLIVLVILSILFTIGLVSYLTYRDRRLVDDAVFSTVQAVTRAVGEARKTSSVMRVVVDPSGKTVQVISATNAVLYSRNLESTNVTLTCGVSSCGTASKTISLLAPAGSLSEDFSVTFTRNSVTQTVRFLGPSALVVYR